MILEPENKDQLVRLSGEKGELEFVLISGGKRSFLWVGNDQGMFDFINSVDALALAKAIIKELKPAPAS